MQGASACPTCLQMRPVANDEPDSLQPCISATPLPPAFWSVLPSTMLDVLVLDRSRPTARLGNCVQTSESASTLHRKLQWVMRVLSDSDQSTNAPTTMHASSNLCRCLAS